MLEKTSKIFEKIWNQPPKNSFEQLLGRSSYESDRQYVWCLSTGRVGTETIARLGDLPKNVFGVHEPKPSLYGLGKVAYEDDSTLSDRAIIEGLRSVRSHSSRFVTEPVYIETSPQVTFLARQLLVAFPNSKFVHVVRHPGEVIVSAMRREWYSGNRNDRWRIAPRDLKLSSSCFWSDASPFQKNVWNWVETNNWIFDFISSLPGDKYLTLKSEDIFSGDVNTLGEFYRFIGGAEPTNKEIQSVLVGKYNRQAVGSYPSMESWPNEDVDFLRREAGCVLRRHHYDIQM